MSTLTIGFVLDRYEQATAGLPARFDGLSADTLFALEYPDGIDGRSLPDLAQEFTEQLLVALADWRANLDMLRVRVSRDDVVTKTALYRAWDAGRVDYTQALNAVREAWLQYSFRWVGGPDLPYPFDLPQTEARR